MHKEGVGHRATRRDGIEEQVERVPPGAELDLGIRIERVVVDRLDQGALHQVGRAGDQHEQIGDAADRLIGVAHLVIDVDRPGGRDHTDEQADADQHLKAEGDKPHTLATNGGQRRSHRNPDRRDHHDQRLVTRVGKDHRDETECIYRLGEAVIGVEARIDGKGRRGGEQCGDRDNGAKDPTHHWSTYWLRFAAAPAASRASRSR